MKRDPGEVLLRGESTRLVRRTRDGRAVLVREALPGVRPAAAALRIRHDAELHAGLRGGGSPRFLELVDDAAGPRLVLEDPGGELLAGRPREGLVGALQVGIAVAEALQRVHAEGVIHGHPQPTAILVAPSGERAWLTGFDLGTRLAAATPDSTAPGVLSGRLAYLSPEQTGRMNRSVGYRSDYYTLGVTLFELLTGRLPFEAEDAIGWVHAHVARRPPSASTVEPGVPAAVAAIVDRLLEKNPEDRYQSSRGLLADLRRAHEALRDQGVVEPFELGEQDLTERFTLPERLVGREEEAARLVAFARDAGAEPRVLLVAGRSGIGKTALVREVHRPITERRGWFASGKAEPHARHIPYYALLPALADLVDQLLTESEEAVESHRRRVGAALAPNGGVLVQLLPELGALIGAQPPPPELGPVETRERFTLVLGRFLQALATEDRPLVLFLDDLQWVDPATLAALRTVLTDPATRHLLLLGAYRSNEVDGHHPLPVAVEALREQGLRVETLSLQPLPERAVEELVAGVVGEGLGDRRGLVRLVMEKTGANPFFARSFLERLHAEGLLSWDADRGGWTWDLGRIAAQQYTDNVIDHLAERIGRLPEEVQEVLRVGAAVGARFGIDVVARAVGRDRTACGRALWAAAEQGLLDPLGDALGVDELLGASLTGRAAAAFRFVHDRIQEAAYAGIEPGRRQALHLALGRLLMQESRQEHLDEAVFDILSQWSRAGAPPDPAERLSLARLCLRAGRRARSAGAQDAAAGYFEQGRSLLPEDAWSSCYEEALALGGELVPALFFAGRPAEAGSLADEVVSQARTAADQLPVRAARILMLTAGGDLGGAVDATVDAGRLMGLEIEPLRSQEEVGAAFGALLAELGETSLAELALRAEVEDPAQRTVQQLIIRALPAASMAESPYYLAMVFALARHARDHGVTVESPSLFGNLAIFHEMIGMREQAYAIAVAGEELRERFGRGSGGIIENNVFVFPWYRPARQGAAAIRAGIAASLHEGHLNNWGYCVNQAIKDGFLCGEPLAKLEDDAEAAWKALTYRNQLPARGTVEVFGQAIACLRGGAQDPARLAGRWTDAEAVLPTWLELKVGPLVQYIVNLQCMLAYLFGDAGRAVERGRYAEDVCTGGIQALALIHPHRLWYRSLAALALPEAERAPHLDSVRADLDALREFSARVPVNYAHRARLVEAELARVEGRALDAMQAYDEAIELAGRHPFPQDVALAQELAAAFHLAQGRESMGRYYLQRALRGYAAWGADAKVAQLARRFGGGPERPAAGLDVETVLKATEAMNSSLVLDRLLDRLMALLLENAGARRGAIALRRGATLHLEALRSLDGGAAELGDDVPLEERADLPGAVLRYVARSRQMVLCEDARHDRRFSEVPAIRDRGVRSLLCLPLLRRGELVGVLYLDNDLASGAFSRERVALLEALSSQMAIAMENARLYAEMEDQARAFARFVPREFLRFIGRDSVQEVRLGDAVQRDMSVLFSDIRGFTRISEGMSPSDNFQYLSDYLQRVGPVVRANRGFVDKYVGDAVMALFAGPADDALRAALDMLAQVRELNRSLDDTRSIRIGVGVHRGSLMLGVLGEVERMDGTVISDAVNVGARLEALCKTYGVDILASERALADCRQPARFPHRCLGDEPLRGRAEPLRIYEVFAGDRPELLRAKLETRAVFEEAVTALTERRATDAILGFKEVQTRLPDDPVTDLLLRRAAQMITGRMAPV